MPSKGGACFRCIHLPRAIAACRHCSFPRKHANPPNAITAGTTATPLPIKTAELGNNNMKMIIIVVMLAGVLSVCAKQVKDNSAPSLKVTEITATPSNYVGNVVCVAGKITKLEKDGLAADSFLVTVDNAIEVRVNVRVMARYYAPDGVCLYRPPTGSPMICAGKEAPSFRKPRSPSGGHGQMRAIEGPGTRLYGISDDVIVRGALRQSGSKLLLEATSFKINTSAAK